MHRTATASSQQSSSVINDPAATFDCQQCSRSFRRPGDLKRQETMEGITVTQIACALHW